DARQAGAVREKRGGLRADSAGDRGEGREGPGVGGEELLLHAAICEAAERDEDRVRGGGFRGPGGAFSAGSVRGGAGGGEGARGAARGDEAAAVSVRTDAVDDSERGDGVDLRAADREREGG